jgi:hypothetical protein
MGLFDILKQFGVGVGSGLDYAQKSIGNFNLTQKYGPNWQEQFADQNARFQENARRRAHAEFTREQDQANAPIALENRQLYNQALKDQAQNRASKKEEDEAYDAGFTEQVQSYSEIDRALINSKKVWDRVGNSHLADPAGEQLPKTTEAQNRMARARYEGSQDAQEGVVKSEELARRQRINRYAESPEGLALEEDRREGAEQERQLDLEYKTIRNEKLREGERTQPGDESQEATSKFFDANMRNLDQMARGRGKATMDSFGERIDMALAAQNPVEAQKLMVQAEQSARQETLSAYIRNASDLVPREIKHKILNGAELATWESVLMARWFSKLSSLGVSKNMINQVDPSTGAFIQQIMDLASENVVGYGFIGDK